MGHPADSSSKKASAKSTFQKPKKVPWFCAYVYQHNQMVKDDSDAEIDPGPSNSVSKPSSATKSPEHSFAKAKELSRDPVCAVL